MAIVNDTENKRVVDTETGEYLTWKLGHWQAPNVHFYIHDKAGALQFIAEVEEDFVAPVKGDDGEFHHKLIAAWFPPPKSHLPEYIFESNEYIAKLEDLLGVQYKQLKYNGYPDGQFPKYKYSDLRLKQGKNND